MVQHGHLYTILDNPPTQASGGGIRQILITLLGQKADQMATQLVSPVILLKAVAKTGKKKDKLFTPRCINAGKVCTCDEPKEADQEVAI